MWGEQDPVQRRECVGYDSPDDFRQDVAITCRGWECTERPPGRCSPIVVRVESLTGTRMSVRPTYQEEYLGQEDTRACFVGVK